jgi:hypothetical protein
MPPPIPAPSFAWTTLIRPFIQAVAWLVGIAKSKLEKQYIGIVFLKFCRVYEVKDKFESLYALTIYELIKERGKNPKIIKLFELPEVSDGFKKELYEKNNWSFTVGVDAAIHTNKKLEFLKKFSIDQDVEIADFRDRFRKVVNATRSPTSLDSYRKQEIHEEKLELLLSEIRKDLKIASNTSAILSFTDGEVSSLVFNLSKRNSLVSSIIVGFNTTQIQNFYGTVSTGKTQLAALLYESYVGSKYLISLKSANSSNFLQRLTQLLAAKLNLISDQPNASLLLSIVSGLSEGCLIIIDNLPQIETSSEQSFVNFVKACVNNKVNLLLLGSYDLPITVKNLLNPSSFTSRNIPLFSETEIKEVLMTYGATAEEASECELVVSLVSKRHPLVVSAVAKYLSNVGWSMESTELTKVFNKDYSPELMDFTSRSVLRTIEDPMARELLYRLNLIPESFGADAVNVVAAIEPAIPNASELFHSITGLWVQRSTPSRFELSPLAKSLDSSTVNSLMTRQINFSLGMSIINKKKFNQFEAREVMNYFIAASAYDQAGFVLLLVLKEAFEKPEIYFNWGFENYWLKENLPTRMDLQTRIGIRHQQIILLQKKGDNVEFYVAELETLHNEAVANNVNSAPAGLLLAILFAKDNPGKSLKYFLEGLEDFQEIKVKYEKIEKEILSQFNPEQLIWTSARHIGTEAEALSWLDVYESLNRVQRQRANEAEIALPTIAVMVSKLSSDVSEKPYEAQQWREKLASLQKFADRARSLGLEYLYARLVKVHLGITAEKLKEIDNAVKYAETALNDSLSSESEFVIRDQIGRDLFYAGRNEEAAKQLAHAVLLPVEDKLNERIDTYLVMSQVLVGKDPKTAHEYVLKAYQIVDRAGQYINQSIKVKVIGEYATSLSLIGQVREAIYALSQGAEILLTLDLTTNNNRVIMIRYAHNLNYWYSVHFKGRTPKMIGDEPYTKPFLGFLFYNYEQALLESHWSVGTPFNLANLFLACFEEEDDFENSCKWGLHSVSAHKMIENFAFSIVGTGAIPYLLLEDRVEEAIKLQVMLVGIMNSYDEAVQNIDNERIRELFDKIPKPKGKVPADEFILYIVLIPYVLKLAKQVIELSDNRNKVKELIEILEKWNSIWSDKNSLTTVIEILRLFLSEKTSSHDIMTFVSDYNKEFEGHVKTIGYILGSVDADTLRAMDIQSAMIASLDDQMTNKGPTKGTHKFIYIPFLKTFWNYRFKNNQSDFKQFSFLKSNSLPYLEKGTPQGWPKRLFKILSHHLERKPSWKFQSWMENSD